MKQCTLVAFYGAKPPALGRLIGECQALLAECARNLYDLGQVHATIVGLGGLPDAPLINGNFARYRVRRVAMDVPGFVDALRGSALVPWRVQLGGFAPGDAPFTSRGQHPYHRSFSIQADKMVLMGWPVAGRSYPDTLDRLRTMAQRFGILHAYHQSEKDVDNDFYLRLGLCRGDQLSHSVVEDRVRRHLAASPPLVLDITLAELWLVAYQDETLPTESSQAWSLADARAADQLARAVAWSADR